MAKKEVFLVDGWLDTDKEYSLDELKKVAEDYIKNYVEMSTFAPLISHYKVKAWTERGYYGDSDNAEFKIFFYRMETDEEYATRVDLEESRKIASEKCKVASDLITSLFFA
jgi:hypothetical protein